MALIALLFWRPWDIRWPVIWGERWGLIVLGLGVLLTWKIRWRSWIFPVSLTYLLICTVASSLMMGFHPNFPGLSELTLALKNSSLTCLSIGLAFVIFHHLRLNLREQLWWVSLVLLVAIGLSPHPAQMAYVMDNPSMAATAVVLCSGLAPFSLLAIFFTHSYTAALALGIGWLWKYRERKEAWWASIAGVTGVLAYAGATGRTFNNGRFAMWHEYIRFWWVWDWSKEWFQVPVDSLHRFLVHWFGAGLGTSFVYFPLMRVAKTTTNYAMVSNWLHNDWLQVLPEMGIVGALCLVVSAGKLFQLCDESRRPLLLAFYTAMLTNFPLHYAIPGVVIWSLIGEIAIDESVQISGPAPKIRRARQVWENVTKSFRRIRERYEAESQAARALAPKEGPRARLSGTL